MSRNHKAVSTFILIVSNWVIRMDDIFDSILNSKNVDTKKREGEDMTKDKESKRVEVDEE
mgnify:CR=1 FL=1